MEEDTHFHPWEETPLKTQEIAKYGYHHFAQTFDPVLDKNVSRHKQTIPHILTHLRKYPGKTAYFANMAIYSDTNILEKYFRKISKNT